MRVTARLHGFQELGRERDVELQDGAAGTDLLAELGIPSESVLVFRGDDPLPVDEELREGETLRVVRIVSGG